MQKQKNIAIYYMFVGHKNVSKTTKFNDVIHILEIAAPVRRSPTYFYTITVIPQFAVF